MFAFRRRRNGPRRLVLRPRGFDETPISFYQSTSLWWLGRARLGLGIPIAALLFGSFLGLFLFTVFLGESRNSERKTDGQVRMEITVFMVVLLCALGGKHKLCPRER